MSEVSSGTNWLDRLIGFFSPEKAYKRIAFRQAYSAGETHRRRDGWMPLEGNTERLNAMSREMVRRKARDLERNSDVMNSLLAAFERNVVGSGFSFPTRQLPCPPERAWYQGCSSRPVFPV